MTNSGRDGRRANSQGAATGKCDDRREKGVLLQVTEVGGTFLFTAKTMLVFAFYRADTEV